MKKLLKTRSKINIKKILERNNNKIIKEIKNSHKNFNYLRPVVCIILGFEIATYLELFYNK